MNSPRFKFNALYLSNGIDLVKAEQQIKQKPEGKRREFLTYQLNKEAFVFIFSFGSVVFVNMNQKMQESYVQLLQSSLVTPAKKTRSESYLLRNNQNQLKVRDNATDLTIITNEEIEITARVLAQSVTLDQFEHITDELLQNIEQMNTALEKKGKFPKSSKSMLKFSAQTNNVIQFIISDLSILDTPNIVWENHKLDLFFKKLTDIFELRSRFRTLEYKLHFAQDNSEFALDVLSNQRAHFLEIVIIVLIVFEILLYFF